MHEDDDINRHMTVDQSKTSVVRIGTSDVSMYSNVLVKRALEEIAIKSPKMVRAAAIKKKILVTGMEAMGKVLAYGLSSEGFDAKIVVYEGGPLPFDEIFAELSQHEYDLVLVSYWALWEVLLEIRQRFPQVKTVFLNSYKYEWDIVAKQRGVDAILRVPDNLDDVLPTIKELLLV